MARWPRAVPPALMNFLLVDNAAAVRHMLRSHLRSVLPTAQIHECEAAVESIEQAGIGRVDAVFIGMGLATGQSALPVVTKMLQDNPERPVIVCSSKSRDHDDVQQAFGRGAFAYIPKPVHIDAVRDVCSRIDELRGRRRRIG